MITNSKKIVLNTYPTAEMREISTPTGSYYLLYNMIGELPILISYDMEKEQNAWDHAAEKIGKNMLTALEK